MTGAQTMAATPFPATEPPDLAIAPREPRTVYYDDSGIHMEKRDFDAQYVRQLTEGDPSIERHFASYFGELVRIKLRRHNWSGQDVDDIRQETFLRVLQTLRRKGLEHPERLGAFVNSVCNNVIMEFYRSHGRQGADPGENEPVDQALNMDGVLVAAERQKLVQQLLAGLAESDRQILRMVFLEETERDEVCRTMNVDRDYLRVLLHRARTRFRELAAQRGVMSAG